MNETTAVDHDGPMNGSGAMRTPSIEDRLQRAMMIAIVAVMVVAMGILHLDPAGAQSAQSWSITPAGGSPDQPGSRPDLSYTVDPGTTITDTVQVWNYGDTAMDLHVYVADALITAEGSYDVRQASDPGDDISSWTQLTASTVKVPAKSSVAVGVRVSVPADATPGDHPGGIVASIATPQTGSDGAQVTVEKRVGTRINVRVDGTVTPSAAIEDVQVAYEGTLNPFGAGRAVVTYRFVNSGNSKLSGRMHLDLEGIVTSIDSVDLPDVPVTMPGNELAQSFVVDGVWPVGPITAKVSFIPNDDPQLGDIVGIASASSSGSTIAWPFGQVLVAVVVAIVVTLIIRRRRSSGNLRASDDGGPVT